MQGPMYDPLHPYHSDDSTTAQRLRQWEQDPLAPEQPGDGLWDRIEADLPPQRRRRALAWWWGGTGAGFVCFLLVLVLWPAVPDVQQPALRPNSANQVAQPMAHDLCPENTPLTSSYTPAPYPATAKKTAPQPQETQSAHGPKWLVDEGVPPAAVETAVPAASSVSGPAEEPLASVEQAAGVGLLRADGPRLPAVGPVSPLEAAPLHIPHAGLPGMRPVAHQKRISPKQSSLALALFVAPAANEYQWQRPTPPGGGQPLRSRQASEWSLEHGLGLRYQWHKHWSVSTGISQYTGTLNSLQRFRRSYNPADEQTGSNGEKISTYALSVPSPYGDTDVQVDLNRPGTEPAPAPSFLFFTLASRQELKAIQVPLQLGYHLRAGRWSIGLLSGPVWQRQQLRTLRASVLVQAPGTLRSTPPRVIRGISHTDLHYFSWSAALEVGYNLSPRWQLYAQPFGQTSLNSPNAEVNTRSYRYGCQLGVSFKLGH